jgi:hypothetical protein
MLWLMSTAVGTDGCGPSLCGNHCPRDFLSDFGPPRGSRVLTSLGQEEFASTAGLVSTALRA